VRINAPGAIARQKTEFGDATGCGQISGGYFSLGAGTDISPLLKGLKGDLCQCPHWGCMMRIGFSNTLFPSRVPAARRAITD
jgi:hypothetical protein